MLDDTTRAQLEALADTLDRYNLRIDYGGPQSVDAVLSLIDQLSDLAVELRREV